MESDLVTAPELADVLDELRRREPIFHRPEFGSTRADFERMTADDFWEIGASGQLYSRAHVLDVLKHPPSGRTWLDHSRLPLPRTRAGYRPAHLHIGAGRTVEPTQHDLATLRQRLADRVSSGDVGMNALNRDLIIAWCLLST